MVFHKLLFVTGMSATLAAGGPDLPRTQGRFATPGEVPMAVRGRAPLGAAEPDLPLGRMILSLAMPPGAQERLERLLADQHDPASPRYRAWLSPEQFAEAFAPPKGQRERVAAWLRSQGFEVERIARGGLAIVFSGDVSTVQRAFLAPMQRFASGGGEIVANALDPTFPEDLKGLVRGVVSLNGIRRTPAQAGARPLTAPAYTSGADHYLAPGDFARIYGLDSQGARGWGGTGATVGIIGRTNPGLKDVDAFRASYGLPAGKTSIVLNGPDPGSLSEGEDLEANLDMQWAGATAPEASIRFYCSASTPVSDGIDLSSLYAVEEGASDILSVSFGACEMSMGPTASSFYGALWAQAAAQGITVCVASGDSGAAGCYPGSAGSGFGQGVSALASTPWNVAVGGTMFLDAGGDWWSPLNGPGGTSALGYIPEAAWNESGAVPGGAGLWATGGGPSMFWIQPPWQEGPGMPRDGMRHLPDVSFTAAMHDAYLVRSRGSLWAVGGTSASSPAFAGILARLVQRSGSRLGLVNRQLYALAQVQAAGGGTGVFHDVTAGSNSVPGVQGYAAGPGYDDATGLGSLDGGRFLDAAAGLRLLPAAQDLVLKVGEAPSVAFTAPDATAPSVFRIAGGQLPPGLSLDPGGNLKGTCLTEGDYTFTVAAADAGGRTGAVLASMQVGPVQITTNAIRPGQLPGAAARYSAGIVGALDTSVTWTASGGTLVPDGPAGIVFSAAQPGMYRLTATSNAAPLRSSSIDVLVHGPDLLRDGGTGPATGLDVLALVGWLGDRNQAYDMDADGAVGETDLGLLLTWLGW